jgi:hypothetical protein
LLPSALPSNRETADELVKCRKEWQQALESWNVLESQQVKEWQAEARRADLLHVLKVRFEKEVPADIVAAVQALSDWDELSRWFDAALKAESLDAFRAVVEH